jgi:hypothetical protein
MSSKKPTKPKILVDQVKGDPAQLPEGVIHVPSRGADAPPRISRQPEVIGDSAQIAELRTRHKEEMEELADAVLSSIEGRDWLDSEELEALRACSEETFPELHLILEDKHLGAKGQMNIARVLRQLGEPEGEQFILKSLKSKSATHRAEALNALRKWDCRIDLTNPGRARRVVSLINDRDPRVAEAAIELCSFRCVSGTAPVLAEYLARGQAKDAQETALKLTKVASTPEMVQVLLPHLFRDRPARYNQWTGFRLERILAHPDPGVSGPVREAFQHYLLGFQGQDRYDQSLVHELAKTADSETIPILEDIHKNATDRVSRAWALEGLARLQPERAVDLILDHIRREGTWGMLEPLRLYATEQDAERILAILLPKNRSAKVLDTEAVRVLLECLGERGRQVVESNLEQLSPAARMWAMWKLRGIDLRSALRDLGAADVIDLGVEEVLERLRRQREEDEEPPVDVTDPGALKSALDAAGVLTGFDAETGQTPCDHDGLIRQFAKCSRGRFNPECPRQTWLQQGEDDYNAHYLVQFLYHGRLIRFGAENHGDWYDVEAVHQALNFALETANQRERFIALKSDGQIAEFVFADPAVFLPIAERYGLPLSDDPTEAMRLGKAYEQGIGESEE